MESEVGKTLLETALEAGVFIRAACGGAGGCGQCKVKITQGDVESLKSDKLTREERDEGYVLACRAKIAGDVTVEAPAAKVGRKVLPRDEAERMRRTAEPMAPPVKPEIDPMTVRVYLETSPPSLTDNTSDYERVLRTLKMNHDISPVTANIEVVREIPVAIRQDDWKLTACLQIEDHPALEKPIHRLCRVLPGHAPGAPVAVAVDIGTTSLWGELVDLQSGETVARASRYNPQISMGEDVISRVVYALKRDGLQRLQAEVVRGLNEIIEELLAKSGREAQTISYMVAAGNTVMTHLFLGLYPKFLRETPYVPAAQHVQAVPAEFLGLNMPDHSFVRVIPGVASYVGGDITAGVLANGMWDSDEMTLYIDIGTNGEIVAGNRDMLMTASCSAGPAFEGGGLEHGMRAAPGAVESILIDPETFEPMIKTIDSKPALGICGSGIINIISQMLRLGVLGQNGVYDTSINSDRVRQGPSGGEYVICPKEQAGVDQDIVLTEVDLDNIARAKGAMFAGYDSLLDKVGLTVESLDRVIIAGAFGSFINLEHAVTIGLLPDIPRDKFTFIGNGSLQGARLAALDRRLFHKSWEISRMMTNVELSEDPGYMDNFMAALFFPHTRAELFPTVDLDAVRRARENSRQAG